MPCEHDTHLTSGVDTYVFFTIGSNLTAGTALQKLGDIRKGCTKIPLGLGRGFAKLISKWITNGYGHAVMEEDTDVKGVLVGILPCPS